MRVLVADDSAFMRQAISQMLKSDPEIEVVGTARDGVEAVDLAGKLKPDVITLDIEMPEMDGLTALRLIMRQCPTQVIMLSSLTPKGSHAALRALHLGAADVMAKDQSQISLAIVNLRDDLVARVKALGHARRPHKTATDVELDDQPKESLTFRPGQFDVICIGSSTGGPPVLEAVLHHLPATFHTPIVVAQHMPEMFTESMAERLDGDCNLRVVHAKHRMPLQRSTIYIAPGGHNIHLNKLGPARWELLVNNTPADAPYKPSVDALFASAAVHVKRRTLAIVLTGMGQDGLVGARDLHAVKATILAQNRETSVVYGMPKAVTENAMCAASLSPEGIAATLKTLAFRAAA